MSDIQRYHVGVRLSEMAVHNGTVYLAGQVPDDPTKDISGQTAEVLANIDKLLVPRPAPTKAASSWRRSSWPTWPTSPP
jgi:hypothetical protein